MANHRVQEIRQRIRMRGRQPPELRKAQRARRRDCFINAPVRLHAPERRVFRHIARLIARLDMDAAFPGHEQPHDFCRRAKIKRCKAARRLHHARRKPCLVVHGPCDVFQAGVLFRLRRFHDKAFDAAAAERYDHTPARADACEILGHAIRIRLRDALHGNIYKNLRFFHITRPLSLLK